MCPKHVTVSCHCEHQVYIHRQLTMEDPPAEVLPGKLWISSFKGVSCPASLEELEITEVVNCAAELMQSAHRNGTPNLNLHTFPLEDNPEQDEHELIEKAVDWVHSLLLQQKRVVVHCHAGKSRSAAVVLGYLIKHQQKTFQEAWDTVTSVRDIWPHNGYIHHLNSLSAAVHRNGNKQFDPFQARAQSLVEMGFPEEVAVKALRNAQGRIDLALHLLLHDNSYK